MMSRLGDWLDQRTGHRAALRFALEEPVVGGASFAYVFGSVLTFLLLLQIVTGIFLAMTYSASATDAWASVAFIQDQATLGWFVRGLHAHGASAIVIVAGLHLLQTALYGAYKKPREVNWILGVLMLGVLLAFALTGYLLPWDQTGYWATKVATGIAGTTPFIGHALQELAQGGNEYGNLTLTRFFALHVLVLPAVLVLLVTLHVALFRRHGVTSHWWRSRADLESRTQPFWPDQMWKDMVAIAVAFAILVGINIATRGVNLDAPADPSSAFDARPEWYFRPLFQALKYFHGPWERIVALGLPAVIGGFLLALPFIDRGPDRRPRARVPFLGGVALLFCVLGGLTLVSLREDAADASYQKGVEAADAQARLARTLALEHGVPAAGGPAVYTTARFYQAKKIWKDKCAGCHQGDQRKGPEIGPGYNSRAWIRAFLTHPSDPRFFGVTGISGMPPVTLSGGDLDAAVELVYAQTGARDADQALVARGKSLFDGEGNCSNCHSIDGTTEGDEGPNLGGRGSVEMLTRFIARPGHPLWFGGKSEMPDFYDDYDRQTRHELAEYLAGFARQKPAQAGTRKPAPVR